MLELSLIPLLISSELQASLFETFLWNIIKGGIYILIAVVLWFLLRRLDRIKPLKRRHSRK